MYSKSRALLKAFIVVGMLSSVFSSKAPRFISNPKKSYKIIEGGRVKLKCLVTGANDPNHNRTLTAWRKEGVPLRNSVIRKSPMWERYKVKNGEHLRIRNIQRGDAGRYWCIAKNLFGMISEAINLTVIPKTTKMVPKITKVISKTSNHVTIQPGLHALKPTVREQVGRPRFRSKQTSHHAIKRARGKELKLSCQVKGNPRPKISWLKNRRPFRKTKRRFNFTSWRLTIKKLKYKDSGVYKCFVWNLYGNITRTFYVQVIDDSADPPENKQPPVIQENYLKNATAIQGQTVTFTCAALSDKDPQFAWVKWISFYDSKYKVLNSSSPNVRFVRETSRSVSGRTSFSHKLKLLNVSKSDQGQYTCFVGHNGRKKIVSAHVFLTVRQLKPTVDSSAVQGLTNNTSESPYVIGGIEIPLAAIIAVPAALSTLLIVAIIWCYFQTVKQRYQRYAKAAAFAYEPTNGFARNGTCKGHQTVNNMESFINGHILHRTIPTTEVNQRTIPITEVNLRTIPITEVNPRHGVKSHSDTTCEPEVSCNPEVRHEEETISTEQLRTENLDLCPSRNDLTISTRVSTDNSIASSDSTNRSLASDLTDDESSQDNSSAKEPNDLDETICLEEAPSEVCPEEGLRTARKFTGDSHTVSIV